MGKRAGVLAPAPGLRTGPFLRRCRCPNLCISNSGAASLSARAQRGSTTFRLPVAWPVPERTKAA